MAVFKLMCSIAGTEVLLQCSMHGLMIVSYICVYMLYIRSYVHSIVMEASLVPYGNIVEGVRRSISHISSKDVTKVSHDKVCSYTSLNSLYKYYHVCLFVCLFICTCMYMCMLMHMIHMYVHVRSHDYNTSGLLMKMLAMY